MNDSTLTIGLLFIMRHKMTHDAYQLKICPTPSSYVGKRRFSSVVLCAINYDISIGLTYCGKNVCRTYYFGFVKWC